MVPMALKKFNKLAILVVVVVGLVVAACSNAITDAPTAQPKTSVPTPTLPGAGDSEQAFLDSVRANIPADFNITTYQGEAVLGGSEMAFSEIFSLGKPVILNFWAGQCPPCRLEMPDLQGAYDTYKDQVLLFGVDVGPFLLLGSREDGRALLEELKVSYPAGTTFDSNVVREYRVLAMPTTFFFLPDGTVFREHKGIILKQQLDKIIADLLDTVS